MTLVDTSEPCPARLCNAMRKTAEKPATTVNDADARLRELAHNLGERIKELNCLYGISRLVEQENTTLDEILQKVVELIEGFETPYGMELLSTVHWLAGEDSNVKEDPQAAVKGFEAWNQRKRDYFKPEHIHVAWERLRNFGWL